MSYFLSNSDIFFLINRLKLSINDKCFRNKLNFFQKDNLSLTETI